ncbi:unnamed protein product [Caenorhabditis auriculariae]|uniref:Uncharacterized protein n=1 Tax=Caenorhabditis auriculariae TaxID=2777116 RepID=A0A8S1HRI5_9PELO|nr:unnamed protein product [Caenorhabditis auriculariae]
MVDMQTNNGKYDVMTDVYKTDRNDNPIHNAMEKAKEVANDTKLVARDLAETASEKIKNVVYGEGDKKDPLESTSPQ